MIAKSKTTAPRRPHHRTLVGRAQRARTEARIVAAAIRVFAEKGPYAPIIDDIVKAAGVARGTFYNYFSTVHEVLVASVKVVSNAYIELILPVTEEIANPVIRFATAARLYRRMVRSDAVISDFVTSVPQVAPMIDEHLHADIQEAIAKSLIDVPSVDAAFIVAAGINLYAIRFAVENAAREPVSDVELLRMTLTAWKVEDNLIDEALSAPLPRLEARALSRLHFSLDCTAPPSRDAMRADDNVNR